MKKLTPSFEKVIELNAPSEILLFDTRSPQNGGLNVLKEFMCFLKFFGKRDKINFAFSSHEESSHPALTIKENYILDSVPTSLIKDREDNFQITAQSLSNPHLKNLIQATECLDRVMASLCQAEKKLVSITKALLSQSEYIFMDRPDLDMSSDLLKIIKDSLMFEAQKNHRKVFIRPSNQEKWLEIATHVVAKNEGNLYIKSPNILCYPSANMPGNTMVQQLLKKSA